MAGAFGLTILGLVIPSVGYIPKSPLARESLGAINQCNVYEIWYVSPHIITFLSERRYPAACGGVLYFYCIFKRLFQVILFSQNITRDFIF
jgi:hypothetical protein